ncbi:unnamed protein product [Pleuronectes platessa]|uniref:Uncharacterized protein n=1 Tax=Pleuronectes platessa TaxID=8262 RepID=A0A9N7YAV3_PLEPL|nr:unnamed protein product [Pleuronectes platessa]
MDVVNYKVEEQTVDGFEPETHSMGRSFIVVTSDFTITVQGETNYSNKKTPWCPVSGDRFHWGTAWTEETMSPVTLNHWALVSSEWGQVPLGDSLDRGDNVPHTLNHWCLVSSEWGQVPLGDSLDRRDNVPHTLNHWALVSSEWG